MYDLKKNLKKSIFAKNSVVIYTFIMATFGGINAIYDLYKKWQDSLRPDVAVVLIEAIDFQDKQFDKVVFNFRNATKEPTSINNVGLLCKSYSGQTIQLHAINNEVSKNKKFFDASKFDVTPKTLMQGESLRLDVLFEKVGQSKPINKQCSSIAPLWSDTKLKLHIGGWIELSLNTVGGSFIVFEQNI